MIVKLLNLLLLLSGISLSCLSLFLTIMLILAHLLSWRLGRESNKL